MRELKQSSYNLTCARRLSRVNNDKISQELLFWWKFPPCLGITGVLIGEPPDVVIVPRTDMQPFPFF